MIEKNISSSFLKCFFQYFFMFKKLEKKYNNIFIEYQKSYFDNFIKQLTNPKINQDIKKEYFETLTLFFLSDNEAKLAINTKIKKYAKYKNCIFLKLFENKEIDEYIEVKLLIRDLKKFNLFDELLDIVFQYLYENFFSTEEKLLCLFKYDMIKDKLIKTINEMKFINFYHSLNIKIKKKINLLLFTKLNFSDYINVFRLKQKFNKNIFSFDNSFKIVTKFELLRTKIFDKEILDKLEENFGIYFGSSNFIEELKSKKKMKDKYKKEILKNSDLYPLIEINAYYSLYKKCNNDYYGYVRLYKFYSLRNYYFEESLYTEIIDLFYTDKKKKINTIREIKINEKEKIKREKIVTKNNYDKINNARLNKYINKKNITRLLLCKRNHY